VSRESNTLSGCPTSLRMSCRRLLASRCELTRFAVPTILSNHLNGRRDNSRRQLGVLRLPLAWFRDHTMGVLQVLRELTDPQHALSDLLDERCLPCQDATGSLVRIQNSDDET
jgi:hypothetical protein